MGVVKTEIISRKCIKPSIPTPPHLRTFKLSLLDRILPDFHPDMTFFFPSNSLDNFSTKSQLLQKSLSDTLTHFYTFAGRFQDEVTVCCNDDGNYFIEARTDISLSDFLRLPDLPSLIDHHLVPSNDKETVKMANGSMLLVKFMSFSCGGTALSISSSHKIADLGSVMLFLKSWSSACRGSPDPIKPDLNLGPSIFPVIPIPPGSESLVMPDKKFVQRRLIFSPDKIRELKNKILTDILGKSYDHDNQYRLSRSEAVIAFIWKCALDSSKSKTGQFKPSALVQAVNLRTRMDPALPENSFGNLSWLFSMIVENEKEMELLELVKQLKLWKESLNEKANKFKGGEQEVRSYMKELLDEKDEILVKRKELLVYMVSSWCGFPLFEIDYGWGKPFWMTHIAKNLVANAIYLQDTKEAGGVEVSVNLDEEEMNIFEANKELLKFASFNPTIN
ncbi:vinorine synthase-like [Quillaja saponaria]|uniref:Vinorine synthase-like n=1 Tax=Quillaja saponaria TaxID=32244 RepID=A0AAD7LUV9_QUISA|nr:vinorine synthase-like [Quillaja saponaria]